MKLVVDILLALAVGAAWLACLGFARLRAPLNRMHVVAFLYATSGVALLVAAGVYDGVSARLAKLLLIVVVGLVTGGVMSHATGRALARRHPRLEHDE